MRGVRSIGRGLLMRVGLELVLGLGEIQESIRLFVHLFLHSPLTRSRFARSFRRPPFKDEVSEEKNFYLTTTLPPKSSPDDLASITLGKPGSTKQREFLFDHTFGPQTSQRDVFEGVASPVIEDVLKGGNGTVFAYGQTGTGKTYTMGILQTVEREDEEKKGVVPRALEMIFGEGGVDVTMSFMQVYCESIQDLLGAGGGEGDSSNLQIREDPRKGFYVKNLCEYKVTTYMEVRRGGGGERSEEYCVAVIA